MASNETGYRYIALNGHGVPIIKGTNLRVVDLVALKRIYRYKDEALACRFRLELSAVKIALAYGIDHPQEMMAELKKMWIRLDLLDP